MGIGLISLSWHSEGESFVFIALGKAKMVLGLLPLVATLGGTPQRILQIRISQETSPGAGNFDSNVLGFVSALNTDGTAAAFYMYGAAGPNYGNSVPKITANTSHLFFVNGSDGLALFVVHNTSNRAEHSSGGSAETLFNLLGGTARILLSDDAGEATSSEDGTTFTGHHEWASENTDGMVIGALPVGFTIIGQFTSPPSGLDGGWEVISSDGSTIPLHLVPGQRVRLDVHLGVDVRQGH